MRRTHYTCSVVNCGRPHSAKGFCSMHWKRMHKNGSTSLLTLEDKFWRRADQVGECWLWTGPLNKDGYGQFGLVNGRMLRANRYAYELTNGLIPDGLVTDHLCRVRHCVNPSHMELVDMRENTVRGNTVLEKKDQLPVGVSKATKNKFRARIWINGRSKHLGYFLTAEIAHQAYLKGGNDLVI